jgi:cysteine desulfurase family protein (TIGR01976 family)
MNHPQLELDIVRNQFPALESGFVFLDNAGGSQTAKQVIERINTFFSTYNAQLGGTYKVSAEAGTELQDVTNRMAEYLNARRSKEVIIGSSTTMLLRILSLTLSRQWKTGDEVIITNSDHEANVSCWTDLERMGIVIKKWMVNPDTFQFEIDDLKQLLTNKTKLVAMVHASNILGTINPIADIAKVVHDAGALICVDGVAYAPHRMLDVQSFGVDFYVFSTYKVYGPHQAVMFGRFDLLKELESINHYFIGKNEIPYKLQPGNFNYELTYSLGGILDYYDLLYRFHFNNKASTQREKYEKVFELIADHEEKLARRLLDYLNGIAEIKIIGLTTADKNRRMPTISFIHEKFKSSSVPPKVDGYNIGIRWGDFYAKKIIEDLGLANKDGVIRVSLVHYNTLDEVDRLIGVFQKIF